MIELVWLGLSVDKGIGTPINITNNIVRFFYIIATTVSTPAFSNIFWKAVASSLV